MIATMIVMCSMMTGECRTTLGPQVPQHMCMATTATIPIINEWLAKERPAERLSSWRCLDQGAGRL